MDIYALNLFIEHFGENWSENNFFCSFATPQAFWKSSAPGGLSILVTSVILYLSTQATLMSPGQEKTRVCRYIRSEFTPWPRWRTLIRTGYFLFVHHTPSNLVKLRTCGDIRCSLLVNPSNTDESLNGGNMCLWIYTLRIYSLSTLQNTDESRIFFIRSWHHKHFDKVQNLVFSALLLCQLFSTR